MIAAYIWHFWLGLLLTFASVGVVVAVIAMYLKFVTAQQYPGKNNRRDD